jgi:hypothetical protein
MHRNPLQDGTHRTHRTVTAKEPWPKKGWIYDCRTNKEATLTERRMARAVLDEFVECYHPENRHQHKPTWDEKKNPEGLWRVFAYEEIVARDKCSLDIYWLRDAFGLLQATRPARACDCVSVGSDYSITVPARSITDCGIFIPRALAVFILITNSNLVACSAAEPMTHAAPQSRRNTV